MTKPTNKERVLAEYPKAVAIRRNHKWHAVTARKPYIYWILGTGPTPAAAWRNAAERMK